MVLHRFYCPQFNDYETEGIFSRISEIEHLSKATVDALFSLTEKLLIPSVKSSDNCTFWFTETGYNILNNDIRQLIYQLESEKHLVLHRMKEINKDDNSIRYMDSYQVALYNDLDSSLDTVTPVSTQYIFQIKPHNTNNCTISNNEVLKCLLEGKLVFK